MNWKRFLRRSKRESVGPVVAPLQTMLACLICNSPIWWRHPSQRMARFIFCSKTVAAPLCIPVLDAVVSPAHGNNIRIRNIPGLQRLKKGFCHGPTSTIYYAWGSKELVCTTSNFEHNSITTKFNCENTKITR